MNDTKFWDRLVLPPAPTMRATDEITLDVIRYLLANKVDHDIIRGVIDILTTERPVPHIQSVKDVRL